MRYIGRFNGLIAAALVFTLCLAIGRIHLRVQSTLLGYEIAELKERESKLLEDRSYLKMQLSRLTTKKHLTLMSESLDGRTGDKTRVASK